MLHPGIGPSTDEGIDRYRALTCTHTCTSIRAAVSATADVLVNALKKYRCRFHCHGLYAVSSPACLHANESHPSRCTIHESIVSVSACVCVRRLMVSAEYAMTIYLMTVPPPSNSAQRQRADTVRIFNQVTRQRVSEVRVHQLHVTPNTAGAGRQVGRCGPRWRGGGGGAGGLLPTALCRRWHRVTEAKVPRGRDPLQLVARQCAR